MVASILTGSPLFAADLKTFLPLLYLVAAIIVGAVVLVLISKWRRSNAPLGPSASDQLAQYRTLYEQGAISQEEYRKLRSLLGSELRKDLNLAPPAAPPPAPDARIQSPQDEPPSTPGIRPA